MIQPTIAQLNSAIQSLEQAVSHLNKATEYALNHRKYILRDLSLKLNQLKNEITACVSKIENEEP